MDWKLFWRLWFQKLLRNIASAKYQWMLFLFTLDAFGMFVGHWGKETGDWQAVIPASIGLAFLGGGFVTFALGRMVIDKLIGNGTSENDQDNAYHGKEIQSGIQAEVKNVVEEQKQAIETLQSTEDVAPRIGDI